MRSLCFRMFSARENCPFFEDKEYEILEAIVHSEMAYFVLPNYCDYPCANYFVFNERSQCFFQGKPDLLEAYLKIPKRSIVISNTNKENFIQTVDLRNITCGLKWARNYRIRRYQ